MKRAILVLFLVAGSILPSVLSLDSSTGNRAMSKGPRVQVSQTSMTAPNATIAIQPNATVDLGRTMNQITIEVALNNTPDVPPFNAISIQLFYDYKVLKASSLNYSANVFSQTNFPTSLVRDCLDDIAPVGTSGLCGPGDDLGTTSFAETLLGGATPDGTQGIIFRLTFDVNTTMPGFSQIGFTQVILALGKSQVPVSILNGYYTSFDCSGTPCPPPVPRTGDFRIQADPSFLNVNKSSLYDPSAFALSTIHITSLNDTSGFVAVQAQVTVPTPTRPSLKLSRAFVILTPNSTEDVILNVSAAISSFATYYVNVTGTLTPLFGTPGTGPVNHSITIPVEVAGSPPDFKLVILPIYSDDLVIAGDSTEVVVYVLNVGAEIFNGTITMTGLVSPLVGFEPRLSFLPATINLRDYSEASGVTISTSGNTPPGNYTVTVNGTAGAIVHAVQFQLTVLPPPVIVLSPSSGSVGAKVTVHGSGFLNPSIPQANGPPTQIEITFDDQFVGLILTSTGSFDFIFNVPIVQAGTFHYVHAKESSLNARAGFLILPEFTPLVVRATTGSVYFRGDTATILIATTLNGQPTTVTNVQVTLTMPNGSNVSLVVITTLSGFYLSKYSVPISGSFGTYSIVVRAHQQGSTDGLTAASFEVKPTWLQSNAHNIMTATGLLGAVGTLGIIGLARRKGYFSRRRDDFPVLRGRSAEFMQAIPTIHRVLDF